MKKVDPNQSSRVVSFEDSDYQQEMTQDPLTTMEQIRQELVDIRSSQQAREQALRQEAQEISRKEAEAELEAKIRKSIADESQS